MKVYTYFILLAIIPMVMLSACGNNNNDDDNNDNQTAQTRSLSAKIDGVNFIASAIMVTRIDDATMINAISTTGSSLVITLPINPMVGELSFDIVEYAAYYSFMSGPMFSAINGSIKITSYNPSTKEIKGTFNFAGEDINASSILSITDGVFSVY